MPPFARTRSRSRTPGYAVGFPMSAGGVLADLDFDFQNGRYYQSGQGTDPLVLTTTSRASTGYASNLAGVWSSFLSNVPRITDRGLLVEEARTNSNPNNSMQGATAGVIGAGGALPTGWNTLASLGLTYTIGTPSTESGIDYFDLRISGTPSSSGTIKIIPSGTTTIAAAAAQTWTASAFIRLVAGSYTNFSSPSIVIEERNAGGTFLSSGLVAFTATTAPLTTQRATNTRILAGGTTAFVDMCYQGVITNGQAVDITLRIGWPQLELGSFATSPIRTTNATVTRAADVVTVTTAPIFGSAYTLFAKGTPQAPATFASNQIALGVNNGTANERSRLRRVAATGIGQGVVTTGGVDTVLAGAVWSTSVSRSVALAIAAVDQAFAQTGDGTATASSALPSTPTIVTLGTDQSTTLFFNGLLERVVIWSSQRIPTAALTRIVG